MQKPPKHHNRLHERHPDFMRAVDALGESVKHAGPLDQKTCELIQLAAAAASRSEGAVHSHCRRAQDAGATRDEVHHTLLLLTSTIGFPTVSAAMSWADDVIK
ncbi:MAG: carboxymuconolactone decarboxylase family protein [Gammaproteobacteria bacterium]|nr:carboxymuconolactone decarboxylase family protein [Gammaproteobacteria bacterium]